MGYHLILKNDEEGIVSKYIEKIEDLATIPNLTEDTIIYQGEENWKPLRLDQHEKAQVFLNEWFRAGLNAQQMFHEQAQNEGLIVEPIAQDQQTFQHYQSLVNKPIKRGDFLTRCHPYLEIEVKCLTFYQKERTECIYLSYHDLKKHEAMEEATQVPVIIAFYKRDRTSPIPDSLRMIPVREVLVDRDCRYDDETKCKIVPVGKGRPGFSLVEEFACNRQ